MARPFTWKEIPMLAVGEWFVIRSGATRPEVAPKVAAYAKRCKPQKLFSVQRVMEHPDLPRVVRVTRLPDPEPEVA